jgi:hypothetical protein
MMKYRIMTRILMCKLVLCGKCVLSLPRFVLRGGFENFIYSAKRNSKSVEEFSTLIEAYDHETWGKLAFLPPAVKKN